MINQTNSLKNTLEKKAHELGFELFGVASASDPELESAVKLYDAWLTSGHGAKMEYLKKHRDAKANPEVFLSGARSVVCVGLSYASNELKDFSKESALISQYTRAEDYHDVMAEKLKQLVDFFLEQTALDINHAKSFVDSAPVFDRFWSTRAGLGWMGKNTCLINRQIGSYFFVGGFFTTVELEKNDAYTEHCGKCRKCIDSCPTEAISEPDEKFGRHTIDSEKCIAYHTIENKGMVPESVMKNTGRWIAGCDICQQVCPWNDPIQPSKNFGSNQKAIGVSLAELAKWSKKDFETNLSGVAMQRMQYSGFLRNISIAISNSAIEDKKALYEKISASAQEVINEEKRSVVLKTLQSLK